MTEPSDTWRRLLDRRELPSWLEAFGEGHETRVVDDIFMGRELMSQRSPTEAVDELLAWLDRLRDSGQFATLLDLAVAQWIDRRWGESVSDLLDAVAVSRAFDFTAGARFLDETGQLLRARFMVRDALQSAPANVDLEGSYLNALARHQSDRTFAPFWIDLASLPAGAPWWFGRYAVRGIDGCPAIGDEDGGFRSEVANTVVTVVESWTLKVLEGELVSEEVEREQRALAELALSAYPDDEGWNRTIADRIAVNPGAEPTFAAIFAYECKSSIGFVDDDVRNPPHWKELADPVAAALESNGVDAIPSAEELLDRLRAYTSRTADTYFVMMTLSRFSTAIVRADSNQAVKWAREAIGWSPSRASGWTSLVSAVAQTDPIRAAQLGWESAARFPENSFVWAELGHALRAAKLFQTAAIVVEYGADRFKDSRASLFGLGLAALYRVTGHPEESLARYVQVSEEMRLRRHDWELILDLLPKVSRSTRDSMLTALTKQSNKPAAGIKLPLFEERHDPLPDAAVPVAELTDDLDTRAAVRSTNATVIAVESRLRRRQAARDGSTSADFLASTHELLEEGKSEYPTSTSIASEAALLTFRETGESEVDTRDEPIGAYIDAYRSRGRTRGKRMHNDREISDLKAPWINLRRVSPGARPAALLGEGRACIAARDGEALVADARWSFAELARWGAGHKKRSNRYTFEADWMDRLESQLDLAATQTASPDILRINESLHSLELDELEEDIAVPLWRGSRFDPALVG